MAVVPDALARAARPGDRGRAAPRLAPVSSRARWWPYVVAAGGALVALLLALGLAPLAPRIPPLLFLIAVVLAGWHGGLGPALLVAFLCALGLDYFFETPPYGLEVADPATLLDVAGFLVVAVLLGSLNARLRAARDQSEAARRAAEASARAREELLTAVSHDLRTPLTAIKTSLSALCDRQARLPEATRARLLANAAAEAERLVHLVGQVLDLQRLEAGVEAASEWNAAGEVVSAVLDRCAPLLGERPVAFAVPDTLPLARFDAGLLDRALTSLLENAALHTPPGTPVAIEACADGSDLCLVVSDAGPGIPPEARERVFAKYERLGPDGPGLGLGLALARAAVEAQGGRIWVEERPGGGARFVVLLPGAVAPSGA
jgi:two-component system sensor histidine kinase KdpD